jgi:NAD-dependent SIR2 family protein deacetylase
LNYDILVDNALTAVHPDIDLDYGLDFVNFRNSNDWVEPRPDMAVGLYKIHGSLNWLYCPVCKEIRLTPKVKGVLTLIPSDRNRRVNCVLCVGHYSYVLVPPTVFKVMTNPHLVRVWEKCERALRQASRVIFCGYSLPDADIHIKYLLKRAQMNRKSAGEFRVTVINHHKTKTDSENITEEQRYVRLFGRGAVKYTNVSFSEFAADSERFVRGP